MSEERDRNVHRNVHRSVDRNAHRSVDRNVHRSVDTFTKADAIIYFYLYSNNLLMYFRLLFLTGEN